MEEVEEVSSFTPRKPVKGRLGKKPVSSLSKPKKRVQGKKRASTRKPKVTSEKKLKAQLWELCKQIIRLKYGNTCYTCGAVGLAGGNWHTAHFIARSVCGSSLRYDLRNLRPQCFRCNISLSGNGSAFYRHLVQIEGQEYVDGIFKDKDRITKTNRQWYEDKVREYQQVLAGLNSDPVG